MFLGSLAFHDRKWAWTPAAFLVLELCYYIFTYKGQATLLWGVHYSIGIILGLVYFFTGKYKELTVFTTTMCENAMLNIGSIAILSLPASLWIIITPASILERTIAAAVSYVIILGVKRALPHFFGRVEDVNVAAK
jgi:hypothetical protein